MAHDVILKSLTETIICEQIFNEIYIYEYIFSVAKVNCV